jgi:hypothetical protein
MCDDKHDLDECMAGVLAIKWACGQRTMAWLMVGYCEQHAARTITKSVIRDMRKSQDPAKVRVTL